MLPKGFDDVFIAYVENIGKIGEFKSKIAAIEACRFRGVKI